MVTCQECIYYNQTFEEGRSNYVCENMKGLAFPTPTDYCSRAERKETTYNDSKALETILAQVYRERKSKNA